MPNIFRNDDGITNKHWTFICVVFCLMPLFMNLPGLFKSGYSGLPITIDDAVLLQAVHRYLDGLSMTCTTLHHVEGDSTILPYSIFPFLWAPGTFWAFLAAVKSLPVIPAPYVYKIVRILMLVSGTYAWLYLGRLFFRTIPSFVLYSAFISIVHASGWVKLADIFVWAVYPLIILNLLKILDNGRESAGKAILVIAYIQSIAVWVWNGALYFSLASAAVTVLLLQASLMKKIAISMCLLIPGIISAGLVKVYFNFITGGLNFADHLKAGFYLFHIPLSSFAPSIWIASSHGFETRWIIEKIFSLAGYFSNDISDYLSLISLAAVSMIMCLSIRRFQENSLVFRTFIIALVFFGTSFSMLLYLDSRYLFGEQTIENNVLNMLTGADRYLKHTRPALMIPLLAVFISLVSERKNLPGRIRMFVSGLAIFLFVSWLYLFQGKLRLAINPEVLLPMPDRVQEFIMEDITRNSGRSHWVLETGVLALLPYGNVDVSVYPHTEKLTVKKPLYFYCVSRNTDHSEIKIINALGLSRETRFDDIGVVLYDGNVDTGVYQIR